MNSAQQKIGFESLIIKLDEFVRKYYKNQMIRGVIYAFALILGTYLLIAGLEYFGHFSIAVRTLLFWSFILGSATLIWTNFLSPLFKMYRLGKVISHDQAALIIGQHFPDIQDKLLNTLQLQRQYQDQPDNELLHASIDQRISSLRPVSFSSAINLNENKKYLKFAIPPAAVIIIILFAAPSWLTKPTERLIKHGQIIAEEAPFTIHILNDNLKVIENNDVTVNIEINGSEIPENVFVALGDQELMLEKIDNLHFSYTFRNIQENVDFHFIASGFHSDEYEIEVLPAPELTDFEIQLNYPSYIKRLSEKISNTGDLIVPEGTNIEWLFETRNTESLSVRLGDTLLLAEKSGDGFRFKTIALADVTYIVKTANSFVINPDSIPYRIQVIPDLVPQIAVEEENDSTSYNLLFFSGEVKDDYGFKRLTFNYQFTFSDDGNKSFDVKTIEMPVNKELPSDEFYFSWDLKTLNIQPGEKISYYFEVWDNDGFNGSKSARTALREVAVPTLEELEEQLDQQNEDIKDKLEESIKDSKKLEKELEELQRQLLEKDQMNWQDKKKLEELLKQQEELKKQVEEIQKQNQEKNQKSSEFQQQNEQLLEKQKMLEDLMQQVMNPELEKMLEELERLMNELNKEEIEKELQQMDLSNEDLEKELDRALEQFKQLEFEQKMEKTIDELNKLAEKQEELSKKSEDKNQDEQELKKQQDELNKEFEKMQEKMDELEKLNQELESPNEIPNTQNQEEQIKEDMKESSDQLQKNKKSNASKSQKNAAKKMQEMAQEMQMSMDSAQQEQQQEDMEALRALLENIITLSFDQEEVMANFKTVDPRDPKFNKHGQTQRKLKDDAKMVEDSLFALSKRVPQISAAVNHEINLVNENMEKAISSIPDRKVADITTSQQYVMTSFNNLALMLDEALKQMQNQASCSKPGQGNCEKPGGNGKKPKPSAGDMKKMQEALSKQLEELKKQGQNKGQNKGQDGQMSQQLAETAAKQAAIRKLMEEKAAELNEDGSGNGNELKQIAKDMEQLQKDIVNNNITEETLRRQQDIMIRLLKAENAERTRDQDNQRKSNEANDYPVGNPIKYADYLKRKERETELLKTLPPNLKPYYKDKVNDYFNKVGSK